MHLSPGKNRHRLCTWSIIRRGRESGKQRTPSNEIPVGNAAALLGRGQSSGPILVFAEPRGPVLNWFPGLISTNRVTVPPRPWTMSIKDCGDVLYGSGSHHYCHTFGSRDAMAVIVIRSLACTDARENGASVSEYRR